MFSYDHQKRVDKRYTKQMPVRFGDNSMLHIGLTHDVSLKGIFLKSSRIYPPQTKLVIELEHAVGKKIRCEG
ncbi:MAG: hypothetical protein HY201_04880, partial [Nitrospirae bacterium]|nr:hypothetical protein [Candidatus Troglogloeales bacterium]